MANEAGGFLGFANRFSSGITATVGSAGVGASNLFTNIADAFSMVRMQRYPRVLSFEPLLDGVLHKDLTGSFDMQAAI